MTILKKYFNNSFKKIADNTLKKILKGELTVKYPDNEVRIFKGRINGHQADIKLNNYKLFVKLLRKGALGFAESFGFQSNIKKFEEINEDVDAYIIDFIFSSTTPSLLKTDKPVLFINFGFPELIPEALNLVKKRCYSIDGKHSTDSRLSIDFNEFDQFINNEEHIFDTSFSDVYFNNV